MPLVTRGRDYRRSRQKSYYIKVHPRIQHFLQPTSRHDHLAEASLPELLQLKFLFIELLQPLILPAPTDKMGTPPKREAQILYFNYNWNWRSETKLADRWAYHCLPISTEHIITSNPTLPDNIAENFDQIKRQFLGYLDDLYAENGVMYGW